MLTFKNDNWQTTRMLLQRSYCIVRRSVIAEDQLVFVLRNLVHFAPRIQQLNQKRSAVVSRYHDANIHTDPSRAPIGGNSKRESLSWLVGTPCMRRIVRRPHSFLPGDRRPAKQSVNR